MSAAPPTGSNRRARFGGQLTEESTPTSTNLPNRSAGPPPGLSAVAARFEIPIPHADPSRPAQSWQQELQTALPSTRQSLKKGKAKPGAVALPGQKLVDGKAVALVLEEEEEDDGSLCFICAEVAQYWGVGECDHRTCHTCSVRRRALYKNNACMFCKHECPRIVFTTSATLPYSSFPPSATPFNDSKLGLSFETREQMDESVALLRYNCPSITCPSMLTSWPDLKRHTKSIHGEAMCELCIQHKKVFSHEQLLYVSGALHHHMNKEHAPCGFCDIHFYDTDLLYAHCRHDHEECFICVQLGVRHKYHLNYDRLEAHFKSEHLLCPHPDCLAQKFVVFATELDLQTHAISIHNTSYDQKSRKEARRIETNFTYEEAEAHVSNNRPSGTRGGGRSSRPAISMRPQDQLSAAEFVEVGRRVIPGLGPSMGSATTSRSDRAAFGRELTVGNGASGSATPLEEPVAEQHAALMKRVALVVQTDSKVASFKAAVRGFKVSETSASALVDSLFNIFDREASVTGSILSQVADLFDAEKRGELMAAWQDLRVQQNSFPSLAMNGQQASTSSAPPPRSTASSSSIRSESRTWGQEVVPSSSATSRPIQPARERFPALSGGGTLVPGSAAAVAAKKVAAKNSSNRTPWSASTSSTPSGSSSRSTTPAMQAPRSFIAKNQLPTVAPYVETPLPDLASPSLAPRRNPNGMEFPSLPSSTSEQDRRARMRAALSRGSNATIVDPELAPFEHYGNGAGWSRSGSPDSGASGSRSGSGGLAAEVGQMQKKKKAKPILLMSHSNHRG